MHEKEVYFQKSNKQLQLVSHALKLCKLKTQLPSKIKILFKINTLIDIHL